MSHVELKIQANESNFVPVKEFITEFFKKGDQLSTDMDLMLHQFENTMKQIVHHNQMSSFEGEILILLEKRLNSNVISIENHGYPLFEADLNLPDLPIEVYFKNNGRKGQLIEFNMKNIEMLQEVKPTIDELHSDSNTVIRALLPTESNLITELFYNVYKYKYINESVYYPEKLKNMIADGQLKAIAAFNELHEMVGHIGLLKWNERPPVYEAAMGIVDPRYKGNGLFGRIFDRVNLLMKQTPMNYCVYDFVTNHDFSQRLISKYGFCDMALYLGNQVPETQASLKELGIGNDSDAMKRYSLLVGIGPQVPHPFGKSVILPANIGEVCGFLLEPLGVQWVPASRFSSLAHEGEFQIQFYEEQRAVVFDLVKPGREALLHLIERWKILLREGYQYFGVDVPLNHSGLGTVYDILAPHGFFFAGFVPYHFSDQLGFRFQFLSPTKVDFEGIKVFSKTGKKLLKVVKENYERNTIL